MEMASLSCNPTLKTYYNLLIGPQDSCSLFCPPLSSFLGSMLMKITWSLQISR